MNISYAREQRKDETGLLISLGLYEYAQGKP